MKIELSKKTTQFLQSKADELGISKEDLARSLLEEFCKVKVVSGSKGIVYRNLPLGKLRELAEQGDEAAAYYLGGFTKR